MENHRFESDPPRGRSPRLDKRSRSLSSKQRWQLYNRFYPYPQPEYPEMDIQQTFEKHDSQTPTAASQLETHLTNSPDKASRIRSETILALKQEVSMLASFYDKIRPYIAGSHKPLELEPLPKLELFEPVSEGDTQRQSDANRKVSDVKDRNQASERKSTGSYWECV